MRAKLKLDSVLSTPFSETLEFSAVTDSKLGPQGENEDNTFARYTPSAKLSLTVTNPELIGTFKAGEAYYVDFTKAAPPAA